MFSTKIKALRHILIDTIIILLGKEGTISFPPQNSIQHHGEFMDLKGIGVAVVGDDKYLIVSVFEQNIPFKITSDILEMEALGNIADLIMEMKQEAITLDTKMNLLSKQLKPTHED